MAENKTHNVKRVRKSRWGPELPLPHSTESSETKDETSHESSSKSDLPILPNGTNGK